MAVFDTIDTTELLLCILGKVRIQIHRIHRQIIKKKNCNSSPSNQEFWSKLQQRASGAYPESLQRLPYILSDIHYSMNIHTCASLLNYVHSPSWYDWDLSTNRGKNFQRPPTKNQKKIGLDLKAEQ